MLLPWNVKPEWPGVKVRRIIPAMDEVEGMTCLEAQRALMGPSPLFGWSGGHGGPGWCVSAQLSAVASLVQRRCPNER